MPLTDDCPGDEGSNRRKKSKKSHLGDIPLQKSSGKKSRSRKSVRSKNPGVFPEIEYGKHHECVIIKFSCGEEIICFVDAKRSPKTKTVRIYYPANFMHQSKGLRIQQWIPLNKNHWYDVKKEDIMTISDCHDEAAGSFCDLINQFTNSEATLKEKMAESIGRVPSDRKSVVSKKFIETYTEIMSEIGLTMRSLDSIINATGNEAENS